MRIQDGAKKVSVHAPRLFGRGMLPYFPFLIVSSRHIFRRRTKMKKWCEHFLCSCPWSVSLAVLLCLNKIAAPRIFSQIGPYFEVGFYCRIKDKLNCEAILFMRTASLLAHIVRKGDSPLEYCDLASK